MRKKAEYSKELKIKACEEYDKGNVSFNDLAQKFGIHRSLIHRWYQRYEEHGPNVFDTSNKNRSYSKEFKLKVIEEYTSRMLSQADLAVKYNISEEATRSWINKWYNGVEIKDYDPKGDVYTMKSRETTFEERLEIVKWVIENDMSYKDGADKFSLNYALVYKWTKAYIDKGPEALIYKKRGPKSKLEADESSLSEIDKLKLELEKEKLLRKRREFELEVLKKKEEFERNLLYRK